MTAPSFRGTDAKDIRSHAACCRIATTQWRQSDNENRSRMRSAFTGRGDLRFSRLNVASPEAFSGKTLPRTTAFATCSSSLKSNSLLVDAMTPNPLTRSAHALFGQLNAAEPLEPRMMMAADSAAGAPQARIAQPAQLSPEHSDLTLSEIHQMTGVETAHADYGLTGAGQSVVVIDSGVAYDHTSLGGGFGQSHRVVAGWDFTEENDADPYDDGPAGFHGTHVAGIIASSDSVHTGVAPDVDIIALRVFNDQGRGRLSWLEASLNWVIDNASSFEHPITAVNMSIGTDWNALHLPDYADLEDELEALKDMGIFVAVAAGNRFDPDQNGLSYPAASPRVTAASSSSHTGTLSNFSQRNILALVAPGENITSTVPDFIDDFNGVTDDFYAASGTSMAAPYLTGASVLVRQAMQQAGTTDTSVDAIREVMFQSADLVYDNSTGETYHRINVANAVRSVLGPHSRSAGEPTDDGTIHVVGTPDDDLISVDQYGRITINGETLQYTADQANRIELEGRAGRDRLIVDSRFDNASIHFAPGSLQIESDQNQLVADGFERIEVHVHGDGVSADFEGSGLADELHSKPTHTWMENGEFLNYVRGAATVFGHATHENDTVVLYDSRGNDSLEIRNRSASLSGAGFANHAIGYSQMVVRGTSGGIDRASIQGTRGSEFVKSTPTYSSLKSDSEFVYADGFELVSIDGNGGNDAAKLYDSVGDDEVRLAHGNHSIRLPHKQTQLVGFSRVEVFASLGIDSAEFVGSTSHEAFTAKPTHAWMEEGEILNYARGFDSVTIHGGGGGDSARLHDSIGDDLFQLSPRNAQAYGEGFQYVVNMVSRVHAVSKHGTDSVEFVDSKFADDFFASTSLALMSGPGFHHLAESFEHVATSSTSARDKLALAPAIAALAVETDGDWVLSSDDVEIMARGFAFQR